MVCPVCQNHLASPRLILMADAALSDPDTVRSWECPNCGSFRRVKTDDENKAWERGWTEHTAVNLRSNASGTMKKASRKERTAVGAARSFLSGAAITVSREHDLSDREISVLLHDLAEEYLQRSVM